MSNQVMFKSIMIYWYQPDSGTQANVLLKFYQHLSYGNIVWNIIFNLRSGFSFSTNPSTINWSKI